MSWSPIIEPADSWSNAGAPAPDFVVPAIASQVYADQSEEGQDWTKAFGIVVITLWDLNQTSWDDKTTFWDLALKSERWARQ